MDESEVKRIRKEAKDKRKNWKRRNPDWTKDASVVRAFNGLTSATITKYKTALPWFFTFLNKTPDKVFEERKAHLKSDELEVKFTYEDVMKKYRGFLVDLHYEAGSVVEKMNRVAGFFSRNHMELELDKAFWDVEPSDYVKQRSRTKRFPEQREVRAIIEVADLRGRVSTLLGYQCGLATGDAAKISWDNLNIGFDDERRDFVHAVQTREKTNVSHLIVVGPDLMYSLRQLWIRQGRPKGGYVFKGYGENKKISPRMINDWFKENAKRALGEERAGELSFKDLRDSYNEVLLANNVTAEIKDVLFGHKRKGAKSSYSVNVVSVVDIYRGIYHDLTVNSGDNQRGKGLTAELAKRDHRIDELEGSLTRQADRMEWLLNQVVDLRVAIKYPERAQELLDAKHGAEREKLEALGFIFDEEGFLVGRRRESVRDNAS